MALHTDTPRPNVQLTVQAEVLNRKRFDPRRDDLFLFREAVAEALRSRGVEAEATPRYSRGQGRAGTSMALTQLRSRIRSGASRQPTETDLRQAREAMQIALGNAEQPAFVSKTRARWQAPRRRSAAAADRPDRRPDHQARHPPGRGNASLQPRPGEGGDQHGADTASLPHTQRRIPSADRNRSSSGP